MKQTKIPKMIQIKKASNKDIANLKKELSEVDICERLNLFAYANPNDNYNIVEEIITKLINKHLATRTVKFNKHKHKGSLWITKGIIKSIEYRDKLYISLKKTNVNTVQHATIKTNFKTYNKILRANIRLAKTKYYRECFELCKNDIKGTWYQIDNFKPVKSK